jgi:hypothetical protein
VKSGSSDYANFGVIGKTFDLVVEPDEEKPVVIGYEKADRDEITLVWSEDIETNGAVDLGDYYHTNSSNAVKEAPEIDGNKMTLKFANDKMMPEGTAYVYVLKESVNDLWDNKNEQQMIQVEITPDDAAPAVKETDVSYDEDEQLYKLKITFTEDVKGEAAIDEDNYVILDDEGEEIENAIDFITPADEDDVSDNVTLFFEDEDMSGEYAVVIKDIEDKAGNEIVEVTVPFTVGDEIPPDAGEFKATLYNPSQEGQMLKVDFFDVMSTEGKYSVTDIEKYVVKDGDDKETALEKIDNVEIAITEDGKSVEITIPSAADAEDDDDKTIDLDNTYVLNISRVADAAGNKMSGLTIDDIPIVESDSVKIEKAEATATDTIKVTFTDELVKFDVDDIDFEYTVGAEVYTLKVASVDIGLKDGKTVATYTLGDDYKLDYVAKFDDLAVVAAANDADEDIDSENQYGDPLDFTSSQPIVDKIAPEVAEDDDDELLIAFVDGPVDSRIVITYTEDLSEDNDYLYAQDLVVKNADGKSLKAGIDFTTNVIDGNLEVTVVGVTDLDNYSIQSKAEISYIKDDSDDGNLAAIFSRVKN